MKRRNLLTALFSALAALPIGWGIWKYLFNVPPAYTTKIALGRAEDLFSAKNYVLTTIGNINAIVFKRAQGFEAFSLVCTHSRCTLHYAEQSQKFFCPCHGGEFHADGSVAKAPPTQAMTKLAVRERGGILYLVAKEGV